MNVNLVPAHRRVARCRRARIRGWMMTAGIYLAVLIGACVTVRAVWNESDRAVADELASVVKQINDANAQLASLQPQLLEARSQLDASRAVAIQPDWSVLMMLLGRLRGEAIVLERLTLAPEVVQTPPRVVKVGVKPGKAGKKKPDEDYRKPMRYRVEIGGLGRSQQDVSAFVLRLEQAGLFDHVKLMETTRYPFGTDSAIAFRLDCAMHETREQP